MWLEGDYKLRALMDEEVPRWEEQAGLRTFLWDIVLLSGGASTPPVSVAINISGPMPSKNSVATLKHSC